MSRLLDVRQIVFVPKDSNLIQIACLHAHQAVYVAHYHTITYYNMNAYTPCTLLAFISMTCKIPVSIVLIRLDISKFEYKLLSVVQSGFSEAPCSGGGRLP